MKYHVLKFNCFTCFYVLFDYSIVVSYEHKFSVSLVLYSRRELELERTREN